MIDLSREFTPEEDIGIVLSYRTRDGSPLKDIFGKVTTSKIEIIYPALEVTWSGWWIYTKELLRRTWRKLWARVWTRT